MQRIKKSRDNTGKNCIIVSVILVSLTVIFGSLSASLHLFWVPDTVFEYALSVALILTAASVILYNTYLSKALRRIGQLLFDEMNSDLLEQELPVFFEMLGRGSEGRALRYFYEGLVKMITGRYKEASDCFKETKFKRSDINFASVCYYRTLAMLRAGRTDEAEQELAALRKTTIHELSYVYLEALLNLEMGKIAEAQKLMEIHIFFGPLHEINVRFDQGRLYQIQGNYVEAIGKYKQAAAIGPKTWIGQESARRAEALAAHLQY